MKKILIILLTILLLCGCASKESKEFKKEYESVDSSYRKVSISRNNPFVKKEVKEIINMIDNKETFYIFFGDELCEWTRSVIEVATKVAKDKNISTIYYVDVLDKEGNETFRNEYVFNSLNEVEEVIQPTEEYNKLLEYFDEYLDLYIITDEEGNELELEEKRIETPSFIYIENGEIKDLISGISEDQVESKDKLTDKILKDEEKLFNKFFSK